MAVLASSVLDHSLIVQSGLHPQRADLRGLKESRTPTVLAQVSSTFTHKDRQERKEKGRKGEAQLKKAERGATEGMAGSIQHKSLNSKSHWWISLPSESKLKPFGDDAVLQAADRNRNVLQASFQGPSPSSEARGEAISEKSNGSEGRRVVFTQEMARELRKQMKGSDTFHDFMYHSAIASRLASFDS